MERETIFDTALRRIKLKRAWKKEVAVEAGIDDDAIDKLIEQRDKRIVDAVLTLTDMGGVVRLVPTNVSKFLEKILRAAAWDKRLYAVFGKTGVGKTFTLKAIIPSIAEPVGYVRINESNKGSKLKLTYDIYRSLHYSIRKAQPSRARAGYIGVAYELLTELIAEKRCAIILDEAQKLSDMSFELLRDIYDETQASIVLIGSTAFSDRIKKKRIGDELFGQFLRRIDDRYQLPPSEPKDVRLFLGAYGVEIDAYESKKIAKEISQYGDIDTLARAMRIIAGNVEDGKLTWRRVGAGQIFEAIERIKMTLEVRDNTEEEKG